MGDKEEYLYAKMASLEEWIEKNEYKAYDPFDGLSSSFLNNLTFNNHYLRIAVQQFIRRFPFNLRPLVGIKPETSSKGMGFCATAFLKLYQSTKNRRYLLKAQACLDWLSRNYSTGYAGYAWGNHFSYESRGGGIKTGVPTIVWSSLIAHAFLDAYEIMDEKKYLRIARSVADFIVNDINAYEPTSETLCFMYIPGRRARAEGCIHNSNVLGASVLARIHQYAGNERFSELAKKSVNFTVACQLPDGGWYYGEPKKFHWVDIFHTGYVLESVHTYMKATGDRSFEKALVRGYRYFVDTFFLSDGTPRYYCNKTYPIDIQCASQGIQTLVNLREYDDRSLGIAQKVAGWTLGKMQDKNGYFYFRRYPLMVNKTPMFHWGQATMLSGLAHLAQAI